VHHLQNEDMLQRNCNVVAIQARRDHACMYWQVGEETTKVGAYGTTFYSSGALLNCSLLSQDLLLNDVASQWSLFTSTFKRTL
jgi:hypothetical protein